MGDDPQTSHYRKQPALEMGGSGLVGTVRCCSRLTNTPYLNGSDSIKPHDKLFWRAGNIWAARDGDWKLIPGFTICRKTSAKKRLASKHPDMVKQITASWERWNSGNIDPLWPSYGAKGMDAFAVDGVQINWTF